MANEKKKVIYFCVDSESFTIQITKGHNATGYVTYQEAMHGMSIGVTPIVTSQMALMTFYQIGDYEAYICYQNKAIKIEEGMQLDELGYCLSRPSCCEDSDILDCFLSGYFDKMLGIMD